MTEENGMEKQLVNSTVPVQQSANVRPQQYDTIDLVELFYLLWGHILQIILCLVAGAAVAFGFTYFFITPQYEATTKMYIVSASNNSVVNLTDLQIGAQLTADYKELMYNRPLLEDVIENLELDFTYRDLTNMVRISNPNDTRILCITVTSPDPQQAADIANEMAKQAVIYLPRIMECETPNISEEAICPTQKASPSYSRNTALGGMLAVALYCGVLIMFYLLDDSFVTPEDISKYFGAPPLATIPEGDFGNNGKHTYGYGRKLKKGGTEEGKQEEGKSER